MLEEVKSEICGTMMLGGNATVLITVSTDKDSAKTIVSYMTGIDVAELTDEEVVDGIAEIVNMLSGSCKTRNSEKNFEYTLTTPFVMVGDNLDILTKKSVEKYFSNFEADTIKLQLKLFYF